jgi:hypothetical protein
MTPAEVRPPLPHKHKRSSDSPNRGSATRTYLFFPWYLTTDVSLCQNASPQYPTQQQRLSAVALREYTQLQDLRTRLGQLIPLRCQPGPPCRRTRPKAALRFAQYGAGEGRWSNKATAVARSFIARANATTTADGSGSTWIDDVGIGDAVPWIASRAMCAESRRFRSLVMPSLGSSSMFDEETLVWGRFVGRLCEKYPFLRLASVFDSITNLRWRLLCSSFLPLTLTPTAQRKRTMGKRKDVHVL